MQVGHKGYAGRLVVVIWFVIAATALAQAPKYFSGVHNKGTSKGAGLATDQDGQFAVLEPKGWLTLDLPPGWACESDGSVEGVDIEVYVDDQRSSLYAIEVAVDHNKFTEISGKSNGTGTFDVDHHSVRSFRYVRIRNVGPDGQIYLDAVKGVRCGYGDAEPSHTH